MPAAIDRFWSFRSSFSYLALPGACERERDVDVRLKPVRPLAVREPGFFSRDNLKRARCIAIDWVRRAEILGMPHARPSPDPIVLDLRTYPNTAKQPCIHRPTRLGVETECRGWSIEFAREVSWPIFGGTRDRHQGARLAGAARRAGLDLAAMDAANSPPAERDAAIEANQQALAAAGHWGVDHFVSEGDTDALIDAVARFATAEPLNSRDAPAQRFMSTVLFTDIVGSTELAGRLGDRAWRDLLQCFHALCRAQIEAFRGRAIDAASDGYFAIFDGPARAMSCAAAMVRALQGLGITIRAGLHTGEVESLGDKISSMALHIGARVMSKAGHGEVWVSSTAKDLVAGLGIGFEACGTHALKGVPGAWSLFRARVAAEG